MFAQVLMGRDDLEIIVTEDGCIRGSLFTYQRFGLSPKLLWSE